MTEIVKPVITYGEGKPTSATEGTFYKDLLTDVLYQKVSGTWEVKPVHPKYKMYPQ